MFNNLRELVATMPDEETCRKYLVQQRWSGKPVCPFCGGGAHYVIDKGRRYKCSNNVCNMKYSVTTNTIFHASKISLNKWLMAYYICYSHKKGISSYQLAKDIGCTQRTAWFMMHRIREGMKPTENVMLDTIVEIDETWNGGSIKNKHKSVRDKHTKDKIGSTVGKAGIMGYLQREGILKLTLLDIDKPIKNHVRENVAPEAIIVTDGARAYRGLDKEFERHEFVDHRMDEFVRNNWHTNGIEGAFGLFKRMVYGIYHQITPKHLERYLDEFTYRYNTRKMKDCERFISALPNIENKRLSYKTLTGKK